MEIRGRTFLITGGASGLGAATARRLAQEGANVRIADLDEETGEELAAEIGEQARFERADVTDEESTHEALDAGLFETPMFVELPEEARDSWANRSPSAWSAPRSTRPSFGT